MNFLIRIITIFMICFIVSACSSATKSTVNELSLDSVFVDSNYFVTQWGPIDKNETLSIIDLSKYTSQLNFLVDWGDGSDPVIYDATSLNDTKLVSHQYSQVTDNVIIKIIGLKENGKKGFKKYI